MFFENSSATLSWLPPNGRHSRIIHDFAHRRSRCGQPGGMPPAPVVVSKVQSLNQAASKSFVGSLVPIRKSIVGSAVDGRVVKLFVDEGEPVAMESPTVTSNGDIASEILGQPVVQLRTVASGYRNRGRKCRA